MERDKPRWASCQIAVTLTHPAYPGRTEDRRCHAFLGLFSAQVTGLSTTMKLQSLLAFVSLACLGYASQDRQILFNSKSSVNLDLSELRLVQFEGSEPVWMTELEKVLSN
jgi:hypothetical protein